MRVPLEWLKEFIGITISPDEVADVLTMVGLEIEGKEDIGDDVVFEVNVTPNRPDCLSILGIARELSAVFNLPLKLPKYELRENGSADGVSVEIKNSDLCSRYSGRVIKDVKVAQSPEWIKSRLAKCGIRSINNIVDITNYVLLEFGHPLHAFDLNTLADKTIKVATAGKDNKIITLDAVERVLPPDALLIWDGKRPVAVAGVMGGVETEVSNSTTDIFLESAYFNPLSIRRTSKALGLKSESSFRFERGTDIEFLINALDRAAFLMQDIANGKVSKVIDVYPRKFEPFNVSVRYNRVNKLLGTNISHSEMVSIVRRLGLNVNGWTDTFEAQIPSYRLDLRHETDIIEEIARIYGFQRIKTTMPRTVLSASISDNKKSCVTRIKELVRRYGFNEAINFSFMNEASLDLLNIPSNDRRRRAVMLKNPLRKEDSLLRTNLIPSLLENFLYNFSRGIKDIRIFEMSKVFENMDRPLPLEINSIGGIYFKDNKPTLWKDDAGSFYIVKGMLEAVFDDFHIKNYIFSPTKEPFLHPGQSCDIYISDSNIGFLGALSPVVVEKLDLKVTKPEIIVFELDVDKLFPMISLALKYSPIPRFPYVERDLAIVIDEQYHAAKLVSLINSYPSEFIEDVIIFDHYKGKNIPNGKKSLALTIRYRAKDRTLTEAEVEDIHQRILKYVSVETGGALRI